MQNLYKYTSIYSDVVEPKLKENDIFRTIVPINAQENDQVVTKINEKEKLLAFCKEPKKISEIMEYMDFKHRTYFRKKLYLPLLESGELKMLIPDKPNSKNQKYYCK